jgi:hypothetical protein
VNQDKERKPDDCNTPVSGVAGGECPPVPGKAGSAAPAGPSGAGGSGDLPPTVKLLLEEWKKNVDLYIDQDKRGMERVRIFLVVNGGLLAFYGLLVAQIKDSFCALSVAALFFPLLAAVNVYVTWRMSKRAHMFILLRKTQGMLIEKKIKTLLAQDKPWRTCSGIVTTFTREHTVFLDEKNMSPEWEPLREEIRNLCCRKEGRDYVAGPFGQAWIRSSMGHLAWLKWSFWGVAIIWTIVLGVSALFVIEKNAPKVRAWLKPERGWHSPHSREGQHPVREAPPGRRHRVRPLEDGREGGHDPHTRRRGGPPLRPHRAAGRPHLRDVPRGVGVPSPP